MMDVARNGHIDVLRYLWNSGFQRILLIMGRSRSWSGQGEWLSLGCSDICRCCWKQAAWGAEEGKNEWLSLGCSDMHRCCLECGHLEVLLWARVKDCPWDTATYAFTAYNRHLEVLLKRARTNGCPWNDNTLQCCWNKVALQRIMAVHKMRKRASMQPKMGSLKC